GGTKNGIGVGEAVVFFNVELAREFDYRCKQGGQLASKMRFLSAPWVGLLQDGAWLRHAMAQRLDADPRIAARAGRIPGGDQRRVRRDPRRRCAGPAPTRLEVLHERRRRLRASDV